MARLQTSFLSTEEREVLHEQTLTVLEEVGVAVQVPEALALNPDSPWVSYWTDYPVSMGGYRYPMDLDEPGLIHMTGALCKRGLSPREGGRVGRQELYKMPFADLERGLRELLARTLDAGGFDRRATSRRSPSTAGRTATRSSTSRPGTTSSTPTVRCPARLRRRRSDASRSPGPTARRGPTWTRPSTRRSAP